MGKCRRIYQFKSKGQLEFLGHVSETKGLDHGKPK